MKKVLHAFVGSNFSEGAFEFALQMNKTQRILLTGVFLPQIDYANLWSYANATAPVFVPLVEDNAERSRELAGTLKNEGIDWRAFP